MMLDAFRLFVSMFLCVHRNHSCLSLSSLLICLDSERASGQRRLVMRHRKVIISLISC